MFEATLRSWGYDVQAVANGAEALQIIRGKDAPSIALLDWVMPEMDGLEVCRRAREHYGTISASP